MPRVTAKDKRNGMLKKWVAKQSDHQPPLFECICVENEKVVASDRVSLIVMDAPKEDNLIRNVYDGRILENASLYDWQSNIIDSRDAAYEGTIHIENPNLLKRIADSVYKYISPNEFNSMVLIRRGGQLYLYSRYGEVDIKLHIGHTDKESAETDWLLVLEGSFLTKFFDLCCFTEKKDWKLTVDRGKVGKKFPTRIMLERNKTMVFTAIVTRLHREYGGYGEAFDNLYKGISEEFTGSIPQWEEYKPVELDDFLD